MVLNCWAAQNEGKAAAAWWVGHALVQHQPRVQGGTKDCLESAGTIVKPSNKLEVSAACMQGPTQLTAVPWEASGLWHSELGR